MTVGDIIWLCLIVVVYVIWDSYRGVNPWSGDNDENEISCAAVCDDECDGGSC